jgi:putative oxidoreductase
MIFILINNRYNKITTRGVIMKGEGMLGKFFIRGEEYWYTVFRVIAGLVFILHGLMKFGNGVPGNTLMLVAGIIEIVGGIAIATGIWTRLFALIGALEMIVAWFMAHAPKGWNPLYNGGEAAMLFFIIFLVLLIHGGGKYTIEHWMKKKEFI